MKRFPNVEQEMGIRCACGRAIVDGWEWLMYVTTIRNLQMVHQTQKIHTCGTGCAIEKRLEKEGPEEGLVARIPLKIEWLVDPEPATKELQR